jgi:CheY-like chemotaxis protein
MTKRILVIDDDEAVRKLFSRALEDTPYEVHTADSGEKGLELSSMVSYDLIFLDLYMPGMSGIEVMRELRKTDMDVFIYIVTAYYKEFLDEISNAINDGLKFEITHKSNTFEKIALIAKDTLEGSKVHQ